MMRSGKCFPHVSKMSALTYNTCEQRCYKKGLKIPNGVIRIRKSKKDRQHNGQKKKDKKQSTKHTHKTKDRVTRTPLKLGVNWGASKG